MELIVLGSSSSGNGYILKGDKEVLLLEAGIGLPTVKKELEYDLFRVAGCLITHEHGDHAKYASKYSQAGIDLYSSKGTFDKIGETGHRSNVLKKFKQTKIGEEFKVFAFDVRHDCQEPYGYMITHPEIGNLLFATDTYYLPYKFMGLNNILVEVNYDTQTLEDNVRSGKTHSVVRDRVKESHMSIQTFMQFLNVNDISQVRNIVMIHLSQSNSNPVKFKKDVAEATGIMTYVAEKGSRINLNEVPF